MRHNYVEASRIDSENAWFSINITSSRNQMSIYNIFNIACFL